jgi:hypothetical protein
VDQEAYRDSLTDYEAEDETENHPDSADQEGDASQ